MNIFEAIQKSDIVRIAHWTGVITLQDDGFYTMGGVHYPLNKNLLKRTDWQALTEVVNEKTVILDGKKYTIEE